MAIVTGCWLYIVLHNLYVLAVYTYIHIINNKNERYWYQDINFLFPYTAEVTLCEKKRTGM